MTPPPQLDPRLRQLLADLRGRVRRYVWVQGLALAVAWLGAAFWVSLGVDWLFEPPAAFRVGVLVVAAAGLAWVLYRWILRRVFVRLADRNMAMVLERRFPQFNESLLTAVELTGRPPLPSEWDAAMLDHTCREAAGPVGSVELGRVFNPVPWWRSITLAAAAVVSVALFGLLASAALGIWFQRNVCLAGVPWPRNTRLEIEGFPDGVAKVARGADLEVIAKADLSMPLVPQVVEIRYRTESGARDRKPMTREGTADPATDAFQLYSHRFQSVLAPIRFDVIGGDDILRNLRIEVVDSPTLVDMELECRYPSYMRRPDRTLRVTGVMQIPRGTEVTVLATANKDVVYAEVASALDDAPSGAARVEPEEADEPRRLRYSLGTLGEDRTLLWTLYDTDGIKSRDPVRLALAAAPDEAPHLSVRLRGIGSAVTPQARVPAVGQITDDYGVARVWFEHAIDDGQPNTQPVASLTGNSTSLDLDHAVEVRDLELLPGQKFQLAVKAADCCDLAGEPNVGTSERWLLDVVTSDELRTILESRELVLRQRFERIIEEVIEVRDLLERMELEEPAAEEAAGGEAGEETAEEAEAERPAGAEPGEEEPPAPALSPQRQLARRKLRVERALQTSQKDSYEVLGLAEAFDDIRLEMINNRIDTTELRTRLERHIADPLRKIGEESFPELDRRLGRLDAALADLAAAPDRRREAVGQLDAILRQMREVLARMIELEDYNEAVELLREIIEGQERISELTRERQKQKLRDLLED